MKINVNKLIFTTLCAVMIALTIVLFGLILITDYEILKYVTLTAVYIESLYLVKVVHKYPLYLNKSSK